MVLGFLASIASRFVPVIGTIASKVGQALSTIAPQAVKVILSNPIVKTIAGVTAGSAIAGVPLPEIGRTAIGTTAATVLGGPIAGAAVLISKAAQEVSTALQPKEPMTPIIPTSLPSTTAVIQETGRIQEAAIKTAEALTPVAPELAKEVAKIPSAIETIKDIIKKPEVGIPIAAGVGAAVGGAIVRRLRRRRRTRRRARRRMRHHSGHGRFVAKEIRHFKARRKGHRTRNQAIAIGIAKARRAGIRVPRRRHGSHRAGEIETKKKERKPLPFGTEKQFKRKGGHKVFYTAKGQPYIILGSGRARFIKK